MRTSQWGLVPYVLIDKFNVQYRASGLGVAYNWGLLIGGWMPLIVGLVSPPMSLGMIIMMAIGIALVIIGLITLSRTKK
ncbi:hypothetical protein [Vulcanisaeta souniana]|uniref:hypothetical protein n=1 Tax=Vulcanisaeta souniana TaxID=164452 RepID=UPI000AB1D176|nr:hypothetical protein [Vulcanisaeta souniana]